MFDDTLSAAAFTGVGGEVGIAGGRLDLGVSKKLADHGKALAQGHGAGGEGVAQVVNARILGARALSDAHQHLP